MLGFVNKSHVNRYIQRFLNLRSIYTIFRSSSTTNMESPPASDSNIQISEDLNKLIYIDKIPYTVVSEGQAEVLFPSSHDIFYNPVQEFNRDLSVAIVRQFTSDPSLTKKKKKRPQLNNCDDTNVPKFRILEALAASGLRSIRFAKEIPNLLKVVANDRDSQAFTSMQRNIVHNKVEDIVEACNEDASLLMYKNRQYADRFDVVDLDPYGTAAPFLDSAVQCVTDGGLLMVTCTDMAILCGNGVEACHAKYGSVSIKGGMCHEMALRIILQAIESHANRYGRYIEPVLSLSVDFYARVFVRVFTSPIAVKESLCKLSMVYVCNGCGSFYLQPLGSKITTEKGQKYSPSIGPPIDMKCNICGHSHKVCGPIWSANLHNKEFLQKTIWHIETEGNLYKTSKRMLGMLNLAVEELEDCPLYHKIEKLSSTVHVVSPTIIQMRSAILNAGYKVSMSHASPTSLKTNASQEIIWDIVRAWGKQHPGKKTFVLEPSKTIMSKESSITASFEPHPDADPQSRSSHLLRFQVNPTANWGPKCRATTSLFQNKEGEKRLKQQNKRKRKELDENNKKVKNENKMEN